MAPIASNSSSDGQGEKCSSDPTQIPGHEKQQYSGPYSHLPPDQVSILKRQIETPERNYSFWRIYRYASAFDLLIIFTATVASCASGAAMPCMTLVFGGMQGLFQDYLVLQTIDRDEFQSQINSYALYFVYLGIGSFFATYISTVGFLHTGENITVNLRQRYLESCLHQNVGFYDKTSAGEVAGKITSDANRIQDGISEKVSLLITAVATLISSFIIGFTMSWKLTLIMSSIFFTLLLGMLIFGKVLAKFTQPLTMAIIKGSTVAHEAFTTVRVAIAFGSQGYLVDQYDKHLKASQKYGFKIKGSVALLMAFIMGLSPLTYSLGFWQGSLFLVRGEMSIETMITTIMVMLIGSFNVGSIGPYLQAYTTALNTAAQLMVVIDRKPTVDATENGTGERPDQVRGSIRLEGIKHIYPSRPEVVAFDNLTVEFDAGKTTAIVGPSGSGKSTIIGLLERYYEPVEGKILVDGRNITALNLHWLRQQIGVVSQEPVLFAGTVYDNIRQGLVNSQHEHKEDSTKREMIVQAAKIAHAHDFITTQLANGYDTDVGQRGVLLSGGQKQRIAIARAIVSNPSILLLDEATSALDTKSEAAVQAALDQASIGRTTITIAHRLSTIRNAHKIIVLTDGKVAEQGSHDELLANRGTYYALVTSQELQTQVMEAEPDMAEKKVSELDLPSSKDTSSAAISVESAPATASQEVMALTNTEPSLGDENEYSTWTLIRFVFGLNKQEITVMLTASFFCVIAGLAYPVQAVFFAKQLTTLSRASSPLHDKWEVREESNFWSLMLLMIGLVAFLAFTVQGLTFAHTAEALTRRARRETMLHVLRQDVGFFDSSKHSPSAIGAFLALETMQLASMSGGNLGNLIASFSTVIGGGALAIAIGWKLALVCLSVVPLLIACTILRFFILKKYENRAARVYVQSAAYAAEHIVAIRTVAALGLETYVARTYKKAMDEQRKESLRSIAASGVLFSASQSFILLSLGLAFWYGSTLMVTREYNIFQFYVCLMAIMFGTQTAGSMLAFTPDVVKARHSAAKLKTFFSRIPTIDTHMPASKARRNSEKVQGRLELRNLRFSYPSRPDQPVLRGIDLSIEPGQHVALVGSSGCGKSTMISLIERFYDPTSGHVLFDNVDISSLPVNEYRSHLAYVSQEPTLFQGTIRENIRISCKDQPSDAALEQACRDANIWDFIASLPSGLDTDVGGAGALLSGGQKQRIAIARALLRQPKVLLLDEATSALDSESERVVQEALARAARGRTTVSIAHRLATIRDADRIVVIDQGKIAESGTHEQLMVRGGLYAELVKLQSLES